MGIPSIWRCPHHRVENYVICVVLTTFLAQVHQQQRRVFCKSLSNFCILLFRTFRTFSISFLLLLLFSVSSFFALCTLHCHVASSQCKPLLSWFHCTILAHFVNPDLFLFSIFIIFHRSHRQSGHIKITILVPRLFFLFLFHS